MTECTVDKDSETWNTMRRASRMKVRRGAEDGNKERLGSHETQWQSNATALNSANQSKLISTILGH